MVDTAQRCAQPVPSRLWLEEDEEELPSAGRNWFAFKLAQTIMCLDELSDYLERSFERIVRLATFLD